MHVKTTSGAHVLTPEYYAQLARLEQEHWWWRGMRAIAAGLLDQLPLDRTIRVLDVGCGTGMTLDWIARVTDVAPVGLDRAAEALCFCRARGHGRLLQGDGTRLPVADGRFDLALSLDVIQHLPRPQGDLAALRELRRTLAPGGHLLVRTNSRCGYPPESEPDYHRYTINELQGLLEASGFRVVKSSYVNCAPALAITAVRTIRGSGPGATDPGLPLRARSGGAVAALCRAALQMEAAVLKSRWGRLPFGHSIIALARCSP